MRKKQISSYLVYNIVNLGKMDGKAEPFSWRSFRKFRRLENLRLFRMMLNTAFAHLQALSIDLSNNIYTRKSSPKTFTYLKSTIETLKKSVKIIQS